MPIICTNCKEPLPDDPSGIAPEDRPPCPKCGSTHRSGFIEGKAVMSFRVTGHAVGLVKSPSVGSVLLQSVFVPGAKTDEGLVIQAVAIPWFEIVKIIEDDPQAMFQISPRKWEEIIAAAYKEAGFDDVTLTDHSGDLGRDVIAVKRGLGTVRIIDQMKRYGPDHKVTADDVRALMGVLHNDGASKGFVTTTSTFAPGIATDPLIQPLIP